MKSSNQKPGRSQGRSNESPESAESEDAPIAFGPPGPPPDDDDEEEVEPPPPRDIDHAQR